VAKLKKQQNTPAKIDTQTNKAPSVQAQQTPSIPQALTLSQVIKNWRPRVAKISCIWAYTDTGAVYRAASGSGLLFKDSQTERQGIWVMTNSHVLYPDGFKYNPDTCSIKLPGENTSFYTDKAINASGHSSYGDWKSVLGLDLGEIEIRKPTQYVINLLASEDTTDDAFCKLVPELGDEIVILGYPGIGATEDITATEGIISGFEGDYYITSAKIEHGNSGGVAISIKNNCVIGIPTFVDVGTAETLGRILSSKAISNIFATSERF
jgi:Trypsin-like peptidase domain